MGVLYGLLLSFGTARGDRTGPGSQNLIIVIFYCECYIVTAISVQLFTHHFIMLGCVLLTLFIQIYEYEW